VGSTTHKEHALIHEPGSQVSAEQSGANLGHPPVVSEKTHPSQNRARMGHPPSAEQSAMAAKIARLAGKAICEFEMIRAGDRVAVGLSGGKDSMALLHALIALQRRSPVKFELSAFTIQQGKFMAPLDDLRSHIDELGVRWELVEDAPSVRLVREGVVHGCDICSRYRRRAVYETVRRMGANVIAFGHTADDFTEALLRNIIFTGKVKPLPPVAVSSKGEFRLIRPLMYVKEDWIRDEARQSVFPIVPCACSLKEGTRTTMRAFLKQVSAENPHIYGNVIQAGVRLWQERNRAAEPNAKIVHGGGDGEHDEG
jgi:tRNA 2-thiocytidine biosynthesis protein TtcA